MTRYFKVVHGYNQEDFIAIDETELEKAMYAHMTEKKVFLNNGSVNGSQILKIVPDYHKAMGWNYSYKLGTEDWEQIKSRCKSYDGIVAIAKDNVSRLIREGKPEMIGTSTLKAISSSRSGLSGIKEIVKL